MRRLLRRLDALPRWFRWAFFFPVGVVGSLLVTAILETALNAGSPVIYPSMTRTLVTTFVGGVTFTLFPAVLSPRPWPVGVAMFVLGLLLRVAPAAHAVITAPYLRSRMPLVAVAIGVNTLGGCLALLLIRRLSPEPAQSAEAGVRVAEDERPILG